jgi:DNA invertase Pin-like site-specific DNA recombinase
MNEVKLRFAPLVRVSKEAQEKRGESLNIQTEKIKKYVAELGGVISTWAYRAQEHSTPESERRILDQLLDDTGKGKFDCIIIDDISRWARDNLKSEQGLRHLKKHNVRFFVGSMEFDLFNPLHKFMLTQNVSMAELYAMVMAERSTAAKIKRAKEGKGSLGKVPYGRIYYKQKDKWTIDPDKQERAVKASELFLRGETIETITAETGLTARQLYKLWNGAAGDKWVVEFKPKLFPKMAQTVEIKVPALLPLKILAALKKKVARGRTIYHANRHRKQFLLNNYLFCGHCGYSLSGGAVGRNAKGEPYCYYVHSRHTGSRKIDCDHFGYVKADLIEDHIMKIIFERFGDKKAREKLLRDGSKSVSRDMERSLTRYKKDLKKVQVGKERLVLAVEQGKIPSQMINKRVDKLLKQEKDLEARIEAAEMELSAIPTKEEMKTIDDAMSRALKQEYEWTYLGMQEHLEEMTLEQKRELLRILFGGSEAVGVKVKTGELHPKFMKHGIYIKKTQVGNWTFQIKGAFPILQGVISQDDSLKIQSPWLCRGNG